MECTSVKILWKYNSVVGLVSLVDWRLPPSTFHLPPSGGFDGVSYPKSVLWMSLNIKVQDWKTSILRNRNRMLLLCGRSFNILTAHWTTHSLSNNRQFKRISESLGVMRHRSPYCAWRYWIHLNTFRYYNVFSYIFEHIYLLEYIVAASHLAAALPWGTIQYYHISLFTHTWPFLNNAATLH